MMPDNEIVIVDEHGEEHVFPPGFDPKKAAEIVRNSTRPPPTPASLAGNMLGDRRAKNELGQAVDKEGKPIEGLANPDSDSYKYAQAILDIIAPVLGIAGGPRTGAQRPIGQAIAATGKGMESVGDALTKPIIPGLGRSTVAGLADVSVRHDPIEAGLIFAGPHVVRLAGKGMQKVGNAMAPPPVESTPFGAAPSYATSRMSPAEMASLERDAARLRTLRGPEPTPAPPTTPSELWKTLRGPELILDPAHGSPTDTAPPPVRPWGVPIKSPQPPNLAVRMGGKAPTVKDALLEALRGAQEPTSETKVTLAPSHGADMTPSGRNDVILGQKPKGKAVVRYTTGNPSTPSEPAPVPPPMEPVPSHEVASSPTKLRVEDLVPASKSKRGQPSATPGLTRNDVESIGVNPDLPIKGLTPEAARIILRARAARSGLYRTDAELNAAVERMLAEAQ